MQASPDLITLANRLKNVGHFSRMPEADRLAIVSAGTIQFFPANSTIFSEGEPSAGMFVLFRGHVHLYKLGPQGQQSMLTAIDPVIMFNEVSVLDGGPNLTTAIAMEECETWRVTFESFQALTQRYPIVGMGLLRVLAQRTRLLMSHYEDLSFRSVLGRTAKLLLDLSKYGKSPINRHEYTNHELAARISTVPEALSRSLRVFKDTGDITCTRDTITVCAPDTLARFASIDPTLFKG